MFTQIWHDCILCPFTTKYLFYSYKRLTVLKETEYVKVPQANVHELTGQPVEIAVSAAFVSFLKYCKSSGEKMLNKKKYHVISYLYNVLSFAQGKVPNVQKVRS